MNKCVWIVVNVWKWIIEKFFFFEKKVNFLCVCLYVKCEGYLNIIVF